MLNKNSLIVDIRAAAQVINGKVPNVRDTNFGSDFRTARYAIILLAALVSQYSKIVIYKSKILHVLTSIG
ncbi:MAG: hypothetical protein WCF23_07395 [Candidatus Nitrosopolaris sp.]